MEMPGLEFERCERVQSSSLQSRSIITCCSEGSGPHLICEQTLGRIRPSSTFERIFNFGNTCAGRLDRRWTAWPSGETGTETDHAACQDEKVPYFAAYPSGRKERITGFEGRTGCR